MDNVQNCDSYINIPSSQTCRSYLLYFHPHGAKRYAYYTGFEVLTAVVVNVVTLWDIAPCSPYVDRCFGGGCDLLLQFSHLLHAGFLLG
jgi:hypothetical protein